jgi:hypothetical protein
MSGDQLMTSINKNLAELDVVIIAATKAFRNLMITACAMATIAFTIFSIETAFFHFKSSSITPHTRETDIDDVRVFAEPCCYDNRTVTAASSNISTCGPVDCRTFSTTTTSSTLTADRKYNDASSDFRRIFRSETETIGRRDVVMFDFGAGFAETNV